MSICCFFHIGSRILCRRCATYPLPFPYLFADNSSLPATNGIPHGTTGEQGEYPVNLIILMLSFPPRNPLFSLITFLLSSFLSGYGLCFFYYFSTSLYVSSLPRVFFRTSSSHGRSSARTSGKDPFLPLRLLPIQFLLMSAFLFSLGCALVSTFVNLYQTYFWFSHSLSFVVPFAFDVSLGVSRREHVVINVLSPCTVPVFPGKRLRS